jgi:hypothetical protein
MLSVSYLNIGTLILFILLNLFVNVINHAISNGNNKELIELSVKEKSNYHDLTKYLPSGFVKDASIDYTKFIQKGIDEHENVLMPDFPVLINEDGIKVKSNSKINFQANSRLIMKPNSLPNYSVLKVFYVSNVIIKSPTIIGERNQHKDTKGEWGFGIHIMGSKNIEILSMSASNCWGDGLYIGGDETNPCDEIKIINAKIDSCRRNGISITDGKNIQILNPRISNTIGTSPMAGIDIEPNNNSATIDNIIINNPVTFNNHGFGILIALGQLPAKESKIVRIEINKHFDNSSNIAFCIGEYRGEYKDKTPLDGYIKVNNPKWFNNKQTLITGRKIHGPQTQFNNIDIYRNGVKSKKDLQYLKEEMTEIKNLEIN